MSMTNFTIPFLKRLKSITLSNNERLQVRARLAAYSDLHPFTSPTVVTAGYGSVFSFFSSGIFPRYAMGFAALLLIVGGVSNAAEGSAPGDALYAIKIRMNEPLMAVFAPTNEGQAELASSLAARRIDEAVTLAARGELTSEREAYLSREFETRVIAAAKKTEALATTGNVEGAVRVKADFAARLAGEAQALGAVTTNDTTQSAGLLRAVVATSAEISHDTFGARVGLPREDGEQQAAMAKENGEQETPTLMTATTTQFQKNVVPVAKKQDAGKETTPLRITPAALSHSDFLLPKSDVAIPTSSTVGGSAALTTGEAHR